MSTPTPTRRHLDTWRVSAITATIGVVAIAAAVLIGRPDVADDPRWLPFSLLFWIGATMSGISMFCTALSISDVDLRTKRRRGAGGRS